MKLGDLLRVGRIEPGPLIAQYDAQTWTARVHVNGSLEVRGEQCASLSKAGETVNPVARTCHTPLPLRTAGSSGPRATRLSVTRSSSRRYVDERRWATVAEVEGTSTTNALVMELSRIARPREVAGVCGDHRERHLERWR